jgi:hypothetical protein
MRFGTFGVGERIASVSRFGLIPYTDPAIRPHMVSRYSLTATDCSLFAS